MGEVIVPASLQEARPRISITYDYKYLTSTDQLFPIREALYRHSLPRFRSWPHGNNPGVQIYL